MLDRRPIARLGGRRRPSLGRFSAERDLRSLYHKHFADLYKERQLLSTAGFFATFAAVRGITHAIRANRGPFANFQPGGRHIHHMTFGIGGLLATGYLWMLEIGTELAHRRASRLTSVAYGAGAALTLDEFALWLNLEDVYWAKQGRESIDAVVLFGSLLTLSLLGKDLMRELVGTARASPLHRALLRARQYALHHPDSAMRVLAHR